MEEKGFVYVMSNPSYRNVFKIGTTSNLEKRRCDLSSASGVLSPFKIIYSARISEAEKIEKLVHERLKKSRVRKNREFFKAKNSVEIVRKVRESIELDYTGEVDECCEQISPSIKKKVLAF